FSSAKWSGFRLFVVEVLHSIRKILMWMVGYVFKTGRLPLFKRVTFRVIPSSRSIFSVVLAGYESPPMASTFNSRKPRRVNALPAIGNCTLRCLRLIQPALESLCCRLLLTSWIVSSPVNNLCVAVKTVAARWKLYAHYASPPTLRAAAFTYLY